jgi:hypothetical protein
VMWHVGENGWSAKVSFRLLLLEKRVWRPFRTQIQEWMIIDLTLKHFPWWVRIGIENCLSSRWFVSLDSGVGKRATVCYRRLEFLYRSDYLSSIKSEGNHHTFLRLVNGTSQSGFPIAG